MYINDKYETRLLCIVYTKQVQGAGYIMYINDKYQSRCLYLVYAKLVQGRGT